MKSALLLVGVSLVFFRVVGQCSFTAALQGKGDNCTGAATLTVTATGTLMRINWYRGNTLVDSVEAASAVAYGVTVAGGNGEGMAPDQLEGPESVCLDRNGNIYISDAANYRVQKWAPGSATGVTVAGGNGQGTAANQIDGHAAVYVDGGGNLYVADGSNHRIQKWPPGASAGITVAGGNGQGVAANQLNTPEGVYVDSRMNVYIADAGNNRIQKWAPGAAAGITVAGGNGQGAAAGQFDVCSNLYIDRAGNIFVADYENNRVQEWAPGAAAGVTIAGGNGQGAAPGQLNGPEGVYVDTSGNLYVADLVNNRVQKWVPGAKAGVTVAGGHGMGVSANQLTYPYGVYGDDSGYMYVADFGNNRIQKWAQPAGINTAYQADEPGLYSATVSEVTGCTVTTNAVTINAPILVMAGMDTVIAPGGAVRLRPVVSGPAATYLWTPSAGLDDPSIPDPVARPVRSTVYELSVTGSDGCSASGKLAVRVYYTLRMPGAFTPNGDGKNDLFRIPTAFPQQILSFSVYNRQGNRVFEAGDGSKGWDGSCHGQAQPSGVYIWVIEYENTLSDMTDRASGTVVLIR